MRDFWPEICLFCANEVSATRKIGRKNGLRFGHRIVGCKPVMRRCSSHPLLHAAILMSRVLSAAALGAGATITHAQEWATHPVKVVVPYGPGGVAGVFGRSTADPLTKGVGEPVVVESRGGAARALVTPYEVRSPPPG